MEDIFIPIKPLSVNDAWQGRRYKTDKYRTYERAMLLLLPKRELPRPPFKIYYEFGFATKLSDYDNPCKLIGDILQKKYHFNDNEIYEATIRKKVVGKGKEYVKVRIEHFDDEA